MLDPVQDYRRKRKLPEVELSEVEQMMLGTVSCDNAALDRLAKFDI